MNRRRFLWGTSLLLGFLGGSALYSCASSPTQEASLTDAGLAGADGGTEAGAGTGGSKDAGKDSSSGGSSGSAGKIPSRWDGWEHVGNDDTCRVYRPLSLKEQVEPITWSATFPCPSEGDCLRMDTPWTSWFEGGRAQTVARPLMSKVGDRKLFSIDIREPKDYWDPYSDTARYISPFYDLSNKGEPIVAFGSNCGVVGFFSVWKDQAIYVYHSDPWDTHFFWDQVDHMATLTKPTASYTDSEIGKSMAELSLGDEFFTWRNGYLDKKDMKPISNHIPGRIIRSPLAWGKDAFHLDITDPSYFLWVRRSDGSHEKLIQPYGYSVSKFSTDGKTMAWIQVKDATPGKNSGYFETWELWSSPYTTDPDQLKPSRVANLSHMKGEYASWSLMDLVVHENHISFNNSRVYRISDGSWRPIPKPAGVGFLYWETVYVDDEEVVMWVKEGSTDRTVLRFRLEALPLQPPEL